MWNSGHQKYAPPRMAFRTVCSRTKESSMVFEAKGRAQVRKHTIVRDDGRRVIFFTFEDSACENACDSADEQIEACGGQCKCPQSGGEA